MLNTLEYYHDDAPGMPPSLGHDFSEGIVKYDLSLYMSE